MSISTLPWLSQSPRVQMACARTVQQKLGRLVKDGPGRLHFIVDFDYTLSQSHQNGVPGVHIHEAFCHGGRSHVSQLLGAIIDKYETIEHDCSLSVAEKTFHMVNWYTEMHDTILSGNFNKSEFPEILSNAPIALRDNVDRFMDVTQRAAIPVVVFSAGLADLIECFLEMKIGPIPDNVTVISNRMVFAETSEKEPIGTLTHFTENMIHVYNKNATAVTEEERRTLAPELHRRPNVLVIGDSLADAKMSLGIEPATISTEDTSSPHSATSTVLRVGFFNYDPEKDHLKFEEYLESYDIVLVDDQTFDVPTMLCEMIMEGERLVGEI